MQKLAPFLLIAFLAGCAFPGVYKINVQQGNIVTQEEVKKLEEGMSRSRVHSLLGTPVILNPVDTSREYYIYTFQRRGGDIEEQRVIVYYDNDSLSHYEAQMLDETPAY